MRRYLTGVLTASLLVGAAPLRADPPPAAAALAPRYGAWGFDLSGRDLAVRPGDDFWRYANANWFRSNPIPADRPVWSPAAQMGEELEKQLRAIVESGGSDASARQVSDLYASWMDEAGIEARGIAPLQPYLQRIAAVGSRDDLLRLFATAGFMSPLEIGIIPDPSQPTRYIAGVRQGGLGMPGRDYYLKEDQQYDKYRTGYRDYIIELHRLAGLSEPESKADAIIALERRIAEAHWTPERSRDILQMYNPMDRAQLTQLAPQFNWVSFLEQKGLGEVETIIAANSSAITDIGRLLEQVPLETWKDYLTFHLISTAANSLPRRFDEANFGFFSRTLQSVTQPRNRWKRGLTLVNGTLGEAVGRLYVERHFPASSRRLMSELVDNLRSAFAERLRTLDWMDELTRKEALAKLASFEIRIGGPVRFVDYSPLKIDPDDIIGNRIRASAFQWDLQLERLKKPVDRSLWAMTPQTINASYDPLRNQLTFPAGILQPPYFDPQADPAVNYGAIGAVIGHEMSHGFDDQGRRFDATGRVRDWWSAASATAFAQRSARLGAQYAQYEGVPGLKVNAQLTMGENIGDLGGVNIAYAAYRRHVAQHGVPPVLNGLTGDQRFFLAWAQLQRRNTREDVLRSTLLTDPHSPPQWRLNGVVRNMDAWYRAFAVKQGDALFLPPRQRVRIW